MAKLAALCISARVLMNGFGREVDLASREPQERGSRFRQLRSLSVFSHYDFYLFSPHNCLFASGLSTQADSNHATGVSEQWAHQVSAAQGSCSERWPALPKEPLSTHPCTHTPGFALSAKRMQKNEGRAAGRYCRPYQIRLCDKTPLFTLRPF